MKSLDSLGQASGALARHARGGLPSLRPDVMFYALGTGRARPHIAKLLRELAPHGDLLDAPALDAVMRTADEGRDTTVDFVTEKERPRCRVHVFAPLSDAGSEDAPGPVLDVIDALAARELPFVVHAILDSNERVAQHALDRIEPKLGAKGALGSLIGRDYALGGALDWDRALAAFRCVVSNHEGATADTYAARLSFAYGEGRTDATVEPTRLGGYDGVTGSLQAEFGSASPQWAWHGSDVGIIASSRGDELVQLASLLIRHDVPSDMTSSLTVRGRPQFAFDADTLVPFVRVGTLPLRPMVETHVRQATLVQRLSAASLKTVKVFERSRRTLATFSFDGEGGGVDPVEMPCHEEANGEAALQLAAKLLDATLEGEVHTGDFLLVAAALPGSEEAPAFDAALARLVHSIEATKATMLLVLDDGVIVVAPSVAPASAVPVSHAEVFAWVLSACGLDAPASLSRPSQFDRLSVPEATPSQQGGDGGATSGRTRRRR